MPRPACQWLVNSYFRKMAKFSVVEAKNQLSDLIDRALRGEGVVITRHGRPVVELKPISRAAKPITPEAIDWLADRRVGRRNRARMPLYLYARCATSGERLYRRQRHRSVIRR